MTLSLNGIEYSFQQTPKGFRWKGSIAVSGCTIIDNGRLYATPEDAEASARQHAMSVQEADYDAETRDDERRYNAMVQQTFDRRDYQ